MLSLAVTLTAFPASAAWLGKHSCPLNIDGEVSVTADQIRIINDAGEMLITTGAVMLDGKTLTLSPSQQRLVENFAQELRSTIPAIVDLALEGVHIGLTAIDAVFRALFDSDPPASLMAAIDEMRNVINTRLRSDDGAAFLGIESLDDAIAQVEPLIDAAANDIARRAMETASGALEGDEGSFADGVRDFVARMKKFEAAMVAELGDSVKDLEQRAARLCERSRALSAAEDQMQDGITELNAIDVVKMSGGAM